MKTDGADWDKVMTGLKQSQESSAMATGNNNKSGRKWLWWLLLLLPMGWICTKYAGTSVSPTPLVTVTPSSSATVPDALSKGSTVPSVSAPDEATTPVPGTVAKSQPSATFPRSVVPSVAANDVYSSMSTMAGSTGNSSRMDDTVTADIGQGQPDTAIDVTGSGAVATKTHDTTSSVASVVPTKKTPSPIRTHPLRFYAGVLAGPDVSTVRWQQIESPGYSLGLFAGFRINRNVAVELGALWDHKVYYTSGEYFNKAKADIPSNVTVGYMNGNCNMFEVPISVRWNFLYLHHGNFFATGGFSSYIMKEENYSYLAWDAYGNQWTKAVSYKNSGNDYFSMAHLSAGYTFTWPHIGDVRIEPYYKIPLRGVGIGSLPMTSTGLYIGLTHSFSSFK